MAGHEATADLAPIREDERFDEAKLADYLRERLPATDGKMEVMQFPGGHSNLTYQIRFGDREYVLRRPPLGQLAPKAHDMGREYRVLHNLYQVFPKAPQAFILCEDPSIIGAPFLVMERRHGIVIRSDWPAELDAIPDIRRHISESLVDTLAELHNVDYVKLGLGDFGKPEGFAHRQVTGWAKRWENSKHKEVAVMDELAEKFEPRVPEPQRASLIHNDFKLDNVMLDPDDPGRIIGVFDWEMATIGDPLVDLGITLGYWNLAPGMRGSSTHRIAPGEQGGFMTRDQVVERYAEKTGLNLDRIGFFEAFAYYKTAVVLQQIYIRYHRGQTKDERFAALAHQVEPLAFHAKNLLDKYIAQFG